MRAGVQDVPGTRTVLGLILHRMPYGGPGLHRWHISEPRTGHWLACGHSRQAALDDLALKVAFHGGEEVFLQGIEAAVFALLSSSGS